MADRFNTTIPSTSTLHWTTGEMKPYEHPFNHAAVIISASILLPLMVISVVGNLLTIVTIVVSPILVSVFNQFILSLCVSDLLSALISPLYLYRRTWGYDDWNLPSFFCTLYWASDMLTSCVTASHILLFAILRLISIKWPHTYGKITKRKTEICIASMWIIAFLIGFIPFSMWFKSGKRNRNTDDIDARWPACTLDKHKHTEYRVYSYVAYSFFFYFPMIAIIVLTIVIMVLLMLRSKKRRARKGPPGARARLQTVARKEKEAMLQLGFIAGSFMLGYLPFTAYEISSTHIPSETEEDERYWWRFGMTSYICLRVAESLNPLFYNLASEKMRSETKRVVWEMLGRLWCDLCRVHKVHISSQPSDVAEERQQTSDTMCSADKLGVMLEN